MRKLTLFVTMILLGCGSRNSGGSGGGGSPEPIGLDSGIPDGGNADGGNPDGGNPDGGTPDGGNPDGGTCVNRVERAPMAERVHIPATEQPVYPSNPPTGGNHYDIWARWQIHTQTVPRGYWVHNLEHGAVVFLYRPDAPTAIKEALVRVFNAIPPGRTADGEVCTHGRAVLTPDPLLPADVSWAVVASGPENPSPPPYGDGYLIKSDCIASEQELVNFAVQRRGMTAEDICQQGDYP